MELTQSSVEFPARTLTDWYTLTSEQLGTGAFASVEQATDDREVLLRLKHNVPPDVAMDGYLSENVYELRNDPSLTVVDRYVKTWQDLALYLANFDTKSLVAFFDQLFPDDTDSVLPDSRFELIMDTVENWVRVYKNSLLSDEEFMDTLYGPEEEDIRPTVAIKVMGQGVVTKEQQKLINSAKTEVFGLGRVASNTPITLNPALQFGKQGGRPIVTEPVGCVMLQAGQMEFPPIGCLLDYFYTPSARHVSGLKPDTYYMVLHNTEGPTLMKLMEQVATRQRRKFGVATPLPGLFVWYVAWVMAHALRRSHAQKIIHNDVKLENIMYDEPTGGVTLIDYGLSCHIQIGERKVGKMDSCDAFGGTPYYATVEQFQDGKRYPVSDIWALGVMLWELATGEAYVVPGDDVRQVAQQIVQGVRPDVSELPISMPHYLKFKKMLEKIFQTDPRDRPTAQDLIDYIHDVFRPKQAITEESLNEVGTFLHERGNEELQEMLQRVRQGREPQLIFPEESEQGSTVPFLGPSFSFGSLDTTSMLRRSRRSQEMYSVVLDFLSPERKKLRRSPDDIDDDEQ